MSEIKKGSVYAWNGPVRAGLRGERVADNPAYLGQPVILVHLLAEEAIDMAWCAPVSYRAPSDDAWPQVPRVLCPLCAKAPR